MVMDRDSEEYTSLMHDRLTELQNDNQLKFSREQGFFDKSPVVRLLIGFGFAVCLFAFLHFREVRVDVLELNNIAPNYTVAQIDFDFYDEEATIISKQEAVRDIGKIYLISEQQIHQRRIDFDNALIADQTWRQNLKDVSFDQLYSASRVMEKVLLQTRITDPRTLYRIGQEHLPTGNYQIYQPPSKEEEAILPNHIWSNISNHFFPPNLFPPDVSQFVINFFESKPWKIEEDIPSQRNLRKVIQSQVPDKYTHVDAGDRIIDQGEKVTARHVAMLQAMKQAMSVNRNLWHPVTLLGSLILTVVLITVCTAYFRVNNPQVLLSNRNLFLLVTVVALTFGIGKVTEAFLLTSKGRLVEAIRYPLFVPIAAILLCSLMNTGLAVFVGGFLTIIIAMSLTVDRQGFILVNMAAAVVAILSMRSLRRRKDIFVVAFKAWFAAVVVIFSLLLLYRYALEPCPFD